MILMVSIYIFTYITPPVQVAVFRVADMSDPKRRFKVDVNAQQRYLTGGVVMCTYVFLVCNGEKGDQQK